MNLETAHDYALYGLGMIGKMIDDDLKVYGVKTGRIWVSRDPMDSGNLYEIRADFREPITQENEKDWERFREAVSESAQAQGFDAGIALGDEIGTSRVDWTGYMMIQKRQEPEQGLSGE